MEWFKDELDLVFAGTSLSMIVVSVVCALVRWFHVCALISTILRIIIRHALW